MLKDLVTSIIVLAATTPTAITSTAQNSEKTRATAAFVPTG
jgi:hypothetical protein